MTNDILSLPQGRPEAAPIGARSDCGSGELSVSICPTCGLETFNHEHCTVWDCLPALKRRIRILEADKAANDRAMTRLELKIDTLNEMLREGQDAARAASARLTTIIAALEENQR
jgi:hypothetical protein